MATENLHYEERLRTVRRLGLTTLQQRRLRGDLIETYKIVTGKERIETKNFFTFHAGKYNTKGSSSSSSTIIVRPVSRITTMEPTTMTTSLLQARNHEEPP